MLTGLGLAIVLRRRLTSRLQRRHTEAFGIAAGGQRVALLASPLAIAGIGVVLTMQALGLLPGQLISHTPSVCGVRTSAIVP